MARKTYRKLIVTDEVLEKLNKENVRIVERYLRNFDTKRSDKSVVVKRSDFNIFLCWNCLYNENKPIYEIKKYELMDYFDFGVKELGWGSSRFNSMHSSLNTLFNFMENFMDEEYPDFRNNMAKIEKPVKQAVREKTVLSDEQVESLIEHIRKLKDQQQLVYLLLCIGSGARVSETLRFTVDIIDESSVAFGGHFLKTTKKIKTKGFGKKGEPKFKYIYKDIFLEDYKKWIAERERILKEKGKNHNSIFIKSNGDPATVEKVNYWVKKWGIFLTNDTKTNPKHEEISTYPHCFRHYFVSLLSRKGVSQEIIIALQGWASGEAMLRIYDDNDQDQKEFRGIEKLEGVF